MLPATEDCGGGGDQDGQGRRLHAAGGGAGGAAHQHQDDEDGEAAFAEGRQVGGVEAGGPGRDGLEEGRPDSLAEGRAGEFEEEEIEGGHEDKKHRGGQDDLALHPVFFQVEAAGPDVIPGQEADAADDNQGHDREIDDRVVHEGGQGGIGGAAAHQVKAGVAESGDGVEQAVPEALPQAELPAEGRGHDRRAQQLEDEGHLQDEAGQADDAADLGGGDGLLHGTALLQADLLAGDQGQGHGHRHHTHAADLNQQEDDGLAEAGPIGRRVLDHEARDADGGGGGEQGVGKGRALPVPGGEGQRQNQTAQQNDGGKAENDDLCGG